MAGAGRLSPAGLCQGAGRPGRVLSVEVAWLGWAGVRSRTERDRAPGAGRAHGSCQSSRGVQRWPGLQRVGTTAPNLGDIGGGASWPMSFPAPCVPQCRDGPAAPLAAAVALTGSAHGVWHSSTLPPLAFPRHFLCCLRGRG